MRPSPFRSYKPKIHCSFSCTLPLDTFDNIPRKSCKDKTTLLLHDKNESIDNIGFIQYVCVYFFSGRFTFIVTRFWFHVKRNTHRSFFRCYQIRNIQYEIMIRILYEKIVLSLNRKVLDKEYWRAFISEYQVLFRKESSIILHSI